MRERQGPRALGETGSAPAERRRPRPSRRLVAFLFLLALAFYVGSFFLAARV